MGPGAKGFIWEGGVNILCERGVGAPAAGGGESADGGLEQGSRSRESNSDFEMGNPSALLRVFNTLPILPN